MELNMKTTTKLLLLFMGTWALVGFPACQSGGDASSSSEPAKTELPTAGATLSLRHAAMAGSVATVDLVYAHAADQPTPRVAEIMIAFDVTALAWEGSEALAAAELSDKQVVVQDKGGVLRIVIFSAENVTSLDSGPLVRLHFRRLGDTPATLSFADHQPTFAPPEANVGVVLGPPLVIEGG
jgi:hypothetical protein